ncbi:hypothetical protein G9A89_002343 [Geosiphon pyriformis]|nr:hypothetical protein G9A89_002343 [Geosiphon pyriformis]
MPKVYLAGFSLGGAFAQLAAIALKEIIPNLPKPTVITYGSPRIGNQDFANYVERNTNLLRVNYGLDPIVRNPTIFNKVKYVHAGIEYYIAEGKREGKIIDIEEKIIGVAAESQVCD